MRIVEFPGYEYFAQALPGSIPYSEDLGFISDYRAPETIDHVTFVTEREQAHQYWAHQVIGANTEGSGMLSETLAIFSADGDGEAVRRGRDPAPPASKLSG